MTEKLAKLIITLKDINSLPESEAKSKQIDDFFDGVGVLGLEFKTVTSGDIRCRILSVFDPSECSEVTVTAIQSEKSSMILIEAHSMEVSFD